MQVQPTFDEGENWSYSSAVSPVYHQGRAQITQNNTDDHSSSAKLDHLNLCAHQGSKPSPSHHSLSLTTETVDEFTMGTWCSRGILNLEESPSEESDALREAYRSFGLQEDLEPLHEQSDSVEAALQHTQQQLQVMSEENTELKLQLRNEAKEEETEAESSGEKVCHKSCTILIFLQLKNYILRDQLYFSDQILPVCMYTQISPESTCDGAESSSNHDNTILTLSQDDLVQALNQENRALADRIQQLLAHIELREKEIKEEETQLREHISSLEEDRARLEQESEEQGCLITELTKKTEDDLNTIMDLQQRLEESREQHNQEECVNSLEVSVLKEEEAQLISSQQIDVLTRASALGSLHDNHNCPLENNPQTNTLHVSSVTDQVDQLTRSIQTLKTEQEELLGNINSLREQQREVALSVQTQTEEKQQLTRTIWGLKEEKDRVSQSLAGLKQGREELSRTVFGLKDGRDHLVKSMSGLKEEKEQLTKILSGLEREKQELTEFLSSGREERDQIMQSVESLKRESDQSRQDVLNLKQERNELNNSLKCLKEWRDQDQSSLTLREDHNKLIKSVNSLKEEKQRTEHSISFLKQEEKQIRLEIQDLREERNSLQTPLPSQTQTEERKPKQHLLNPNCVDMAKKTETLQTTEYATQRCQTNDLKGNSRQVSK